MNQQGETHKLLSWWRYNFPNHLSRHYTHRPLVLFYIFQLFWVSIICVRVNHYVALNFCEMAIWTICRINIIILVLKYWSHKLLFSFKSLESTEKSPLAAVALCHNIRTILSGANIVDIYYQIFYYFSSFLVAIVTFTIQRGPLSKE